MNKKKTILIAVNDTTFLYNLRKEIVVELCDRGFNVIVVASFRDYVEEINRTGCTLVNLNIPRRGKNPINDFRLYKEIYNILLRYNPDIVFSNSIKPNVYFGLASSTLRIPFIPNITGLGGALLSKGLINKIASSLYKKGIKDSKTVFFQNKYNRDFFTIIKSWKKLKTM